MRHSAIASSVVLTVLGAFLVLAADSASAPADQAVAASRTVALTYQVHVPPVKDATGKLLLWLPLRQQDTYQQIRDVQIESPASHLQRREPEYGNAFLLFQATPPQLAGGFTSGRDLRLSPEQQGAPLYCFIYPYAELSGKPYSGLQNHVSSVTWRLPLPPPTSRRMPPLPVSTQDSLRRSAYFAQRRIL